jgi:hypothetical protein
MAKFKDGQQVFIKNVDFLEGKIVRARDGDKGQPEEKTHYYVEIPAQARYVLSVNLETPPDKKPQRYGEEWMAELDKMVKAAERLQANNADKVAAKALVDAGSKIGWFVPK